MSDKEWFVHEFDRFVAAQGDATDLAKARMEVSRSYAEGVARGSLDRRELTLEEEGGQLFDQFIAPVRRSRARSLATAGVALLDALKGDGLLGDAEPALDLAYPLGNGQDKTMRFWSAEDGNGSRTERYRNAADATEAAAQFDREVAAEFIRLMEESGSAMTGDLFGGAA